VTLITIKTDTKRSVLHKYTLQVSWSILCATFSIARRISVLC